MAEKIVLTEEERKQRKREAQQRYLEKLKTKKAETETEAVVTAQNTEIEALRVKCAELEKLCKAYAEGAAKAQQALQKATLEYNARVKYMIDCTRHALVSMQFAANASDSEGGAQ